MLYKNAIGILLILTSFLDAWKYIWQAKSILKVGVAKGHSRKFLDIAIGNNIVKLLYSILIFDIFIFLSSLLALVTTSYNFYILYLMYPYRYRNLRNFKRPNLLIYTINSLLPNNLRRKL